MMWVDYTINQAGDSFTVVGDTPTEVMDKGCINQATFFVLTKMDGLPKLVKIETI